MVAPNAAAGARATSGKLQWQPLATRRRFLAQNAILIGQCWLFSRNNRSA